jgi:hypothetical protein
LIEWYIENELWNKVKLWKTCLLVLGKINTQRCSVTLKVRLRMRVCTASLCSVWELVSKKIIWDSTYFGFPTHLAFGHWTLQRAWSNFSGCSNQLTVFESLKKSQSSFCYQAFVQPASDWIIGWIKRFWLVNWVD